MVNTACKYFEIILRVDQAIALGKLLSDENLIGLGNNSDSTEQEVGILQCLQSQLEIEMDSLDVVGTGDSSDYEIERDTEHTTNDAEANGEVTGSYWLNGVFNQ